MTLNLAAGLTLEEITPRRVRRVSTGAEVVQLGWWRADDGRALFAAIVARTICVAATDIASPNAPKMED
jgi:hypothetical protein